tara:strand:+ start:4057 stop:4233 length:177 start_codon:yes stop_codon:yes gene_type:complete
LQAIGVDAMQKSITIVSRKQVQFRRKTAKYGKPVGTFSSNQGYLAVKARDAFGRFAKA